MGTTAASPLRLRYFAWLRERVGRAEEELPLPVGVATVADLIAWLGARNAGFAAAAASGRTLRCAVNQDFAAPSTPVAPGDEVAFFPPVTGG
jgi:sulfur-carrier protein